MPSAPPACCQAGSSCPHSVCFAARLYRQHTTGHYQDVRTLLSCASHLADIVQALQDSPRLASAGKVTVLAIDPTAWHPGDPASPAAGKMPASLPFITFRHGGAQRLNTSPDDTGAALLVQAQLASLLTQAS